MTKTITAHDQLRIFLEKLRPVSEQARKLLLHIHELAHHGRGDDRRPGACYLPELYESCGLDPDMMYPKLKELAEANVIVLEEKYPFEDVRIVGGTSGEDLLSVAEEFCKSNDIPFRDFVVEIQVEKLK